MRLRAQMHFIHVYNTFSNLRGAYWLQGRRSTKGVKWAGEEQEMNALVQSSQLSYKEEAFYLQSGNPQVSTERVEMEPI